MYSTYTRIQILRIKIISSESMGIKYLKIFSFYIWWSDKRLGAFEQQTTGFGSRMMARMGFVDAGLGRESQDIVNPLVAVRRPSACGLGAEC